GLLAAACTAFYMFRSYFLVFRGDFRGDRHVYEHAHESPPAMTIPLALLAVGSVLVGFVGMPSVAGLGLFHPPNWVEEGLAPVLGKGEVLDPAHLSTEIGLMALAIVVSLGGIAFAYSLYGKGIAPLADRLRVSAGGLYRLVYNKYWIDELYDFVFVRPLRW